MILTLDSVNCFYGRVQVLRDLSLVLAPGEVLCLLGRNGAGKTTTLKTIMGLIRPRSGRVLFGDAELSRLPAHEIPRRGIAYVPQGRRLFAELTVGENLTIGLMTRDRDEAVRERVLALFPILRERLHQPAGTLSGGEQEMLAVARALCLEPTVLLLDEPTEGLMPSMIATIIETVRLLKGQGVATILVEQRVDAALSVADRVAFIENGTVKQSCDAASLKSDRTPIEHYVGVGLRSA
jgi:branched-chain amino acid transport system ATP-binding protein